MEKRECLFGDSVRVILAGAVQDEKWKELLEALGVETSVLNAIHLALSLKALGGDVQAAKYLRDTAETGAGAENELPSILELSGLSDRQLRLLAARLPAQAEKDGEA